MARRLPRVLSEQESRALTDAINWDTITGLRNRVAIEVMLHAGLRVSELVALRPGDVDIEQGRLIVRNGKGGDDRVVPLPAGTINWLRRWRRERHQQATYLLHVIKGNMGRQMSRSSVLKMVKHYAARAGIEGNINCHTLRHTYATLMRRAGVDLEIIQEAMGHKHLSTTRIYRHVAPIELEQAVRKLDQEQALEQAVREMDDQQSLEGQPDVVERLVARLLIALPAEAKERMATALLTQVREEEELAEQ